MKCLLVLLSLLLTLPARAESELRELYRGVRAQAMGGASVAMVEDEQAIFLNPAGLAGVQRYTINYAVVDIESSTDTVASYSSLSVINNFNSSTINSLIGKDVYARAQITPSIVMPSFGFAIYGDEQVAVLAKNLNLPQLTIGYQTTYGVQVGYGVTLGQMGGARRASRRSKDQSSSGGRRSELRVGIGGKVMWRKGGYHLLSFSELIDVNQDTLTALTGDYGMGFGVDLGTQYIMSLGRMQLSAGAAINNIGGMAFSSIANPQPQALSFGLGFKYSVSRVGVRLAWDYRNITADADWRKKTHFGLGLDIPVFTLYAGLNQMKYSYGVGFDVWLFSITAVSYAEQIGALMDSDTERRYLLQIALKF